MNSLGSIQSINNKIIATVVSTIVTVLNNAFQNPTVGYNNYINPYSFTSSGTYPYNSWTYVCNFVSGLKVNIYVEDGSAPSGLPELSSTYPQFLQLGFQDVNATLTLSQSIYFPTSGTYQLSYYLAPWAGYYQTYLTIQASVGSQSTSTFSLNPSTTMWYNYTFDFTVSSAGNQTLSFLFSCPNSSNNVNIYITDITITYLHA